MPSFGRWQQAGHEHECAGCHQPITSGSDYMRLGFVDRITWRRVVGENPVKGSPLHDTIDKGKLQRLFHIAAHSGYPIQRWHPSCWRADSRAESTPTGRSAAVR